LVLGKLHNGPFLGIFRGGQKSLGPLEISLEMAHYVVCPQKKIISRIFKISGALMVKTDLAENHKVPTQQKYRRRLRNSIYKYLALFVYQGKY
jgi:hypothetical protein